MVLPDQRGSAGRPRGIVAQGFKNVCIFWWINRKKNTFIWPVQLADSDGRQNDWHASHDEMLSRTAAWPVVPDSSRETVATIPPSPIGRRAPITHDASCRGRSGRLVRHFGEVLRVAFKKGGRVVDNLRPPLIRRLRGEPDVAAIPGHRLLGLRVRPDADQRPAPVCATFVELRSGGRVELWGDGLRAFGLSRRSRPGRDWLWVSYHASR